MSSFTSKAFEKDYPLFGEERVCTILVNVVFSTLDLLVKKTKK
jgi:hypothetical protein